MVESDTPKKKKLQEQIDVQMAREMEEKMAREDQRMDEQIARDAKIARIHAEEELQMLINGLDRNNEVIAKHRQEHEQSKAELTIGEKIDLINELKQIKDFVPMASKEEKERVKRKWLKLEQGSAKKMKTSDDVSEEDLKEMMQLVPVEEVYVEALQVKHPIIDWEIHTEGKRDYWKIIKLGGGLPVSEYYHKLNSLWREFDILTKLPDCTYAARAELVDHGKLLRLMQFLMGLDDNYQPVRSSILTREILPEAKDAFVIIYREESHRGTPASLVKTEKPQASTFVSRSYDNNRRRLVKNKREKDKIRTKPDKKGKRDQVKLTLGVMDLDHALRIDPPAAITTESTANQKRAYEQWERSNRTSLMIIKNSISVAIRGAIPDSENAKDYLSFINYNTQKEKWKMSELIAMCVQEEERLKVEKPDVVHVATTNSNKRKGSWKGKGSSRDNSTPNKVKKTDASTSSFQGGPKYKFCHKKGHTQKDFPKFKEWLAKKGIPYNPEIGKKPTNRHISRDIITRLVKDEVLPNLDFSDFGKCIECLKGKINKGNKKGATRSIGLLELIHTDICGPFPSGIGGHKSFITLIDDYSRYMYLFLINEKSESLDMFKNFKAEVENQLHSKIKVVRSNRGGEYYGRHTDVGQAPGSFFDLCKDHGIINQYTLSGTPQHNGVAERRNCTLMDMVRSMLANLKLPEFLWTEALKMAVHILN
nr:putative zinc finger, CCHC-type [Tanacetum cinerariifolium]